MRRAARDFQDQHPYDVTGLRVKGVGEKHEGKYLLAKENLSPFPQLLTLI